MPSFWTHTAFAKECKPNLPEGEISEAVRRYPHAYYTGMQGPDMFLFYLPTILRKERLSTLLHTKSPHRLLYCLWKQTAELKGEAHTIALSYAVGFLGHYCLDSETHPFVYAFAGKERSAFSFCTHNALEADLNGLTVERVLNRSLTTLPLPSVYALSKEEEACIGVLLSRVIGCAYRQNCTPASVIRAARTVKRCCRLLYDASGRKAKLARLLETPLRLPYFSPLFLGESHYFADPANLAHKKWRDPYTGALHTDDFFALYDGAKRNYRCALCHLQALPPKDYAPFFKTLCVRDFHGEIHR